MIDKDKLRQNVINLLIFSFLKRKKMTKDPSTVDKPAMVDTKNGPQRFILSPINHMSPTSIY